MIEDDALANLFYKLNSCYAKKSMELLSNENCDSYTLGKLKTREWDIREFERFCIQAEKNPYHQKEKVKEAESLYLKIRAEIEAISCLNPTNGRQAGRDEDDWIF